jgi:hypothetical protein
VRALLAIVAGGGEPPPGRVWGTGGWLPPEEREALDWLTLARLSGWRAAVSGPGEPLAPATRWLVLACSPDELGSERVDELRALLEHEPLLLVVRAPAASHPLAGLAGAARGPEVRGRTVVWSGPGSAGSWSCRAPLATALRPGGPDCEVWATLDGAPLATVRRVGLGAVATLGFHPSAARDADGAATALLRRLLVRGSRRPVAWLDLERTLVLRMDDPGGAQNVHWRDWCYPKLDERGWAAIGAELEWRRARLSVCYTPGWVDDGDTARGRLLVDERPAERRAGAVWDAPRVRYEDTGGHAPGTSHDYAAEYRGIEALRRAGLADVELHGHTHLHPELDAWARAGDRYSAQRWFRELGRPAAAALARLPPGRHPLELGREALERLFGTRPTTLVPPGDEFTDAVVEKALELGFRLVESYYLALREGNRFCWCQHVCAPYLDLADPAWLAAGLPVVGYFHDNDVTSEDVGWLRRWLDAWQEAGVERMLDFRELAAAVDRRLELEQERGGLVLRVEGGEAPPLVRPLRVRLWGGGGELPAQLDVVHERDEARVRVEGGGEEAVVEVPLPRRF